MTEKRILLSVPEKRVMGMPVYYSNGKPIVYEQVHLTPDLKDEYQQAAEGHIEGLLTDRLDDNMKCMKAIKREKIKLLEELMENPKNTEHVTYLPITIKDKLNQLKKG